MREILVCVHEGKYLVEWHLDTVDLFEVHLEDLIKKPLAISVEKSA